MCGADAYRVRFSPNQELPAPYLVEGYDGTFYGCTESGSWIGDVTGDRFQARRDALNHKHLMEAD